MARTLTAFIRATTGERELSVGLVASIQTHGSLANWHPHLHLLVTDGGFRPDGSFMPLALHDVATLTEAFRRAVLRRFVRRGLLEEASARHAGPTALGVHGHGGVWVPAEDRALATRLARYRARHPVALKRLSRCGHAMRLVGVITQPHVIDRILAHLRRPAPPARRASARAPARPPHSLAAASLDGSFSQPYFGRPD
ncbi:MAG TPA: transposase [Gemmatimonadales bacterium]